MRRALLVLLVIACAGPSLAAQPTPPKAKPKIEAVPAAAPLNATSGAILPPPIPLAVGRPYGDAAQCRATCSRTLYFCSASGEDDSCGGRWASCNASCSASYVPPRFGGR
ncbi:hypothetical protein [Caulobacter sp.]|jgi:hypothetical protein|uniref:hypothetical protein n=1 Tax=Caulobacter sp. TaxID=78 RepID=UPI00160E3190